MHRTTVAALLGCVITWATLAVGGPAAAKSAFKDGNRLLRDCNSPGAFSRGICLGFIQGVSDSPVNGSRICFPAGVLGSQLKEVVVRFLEANPAKRDQDAAELVTWALADAYLCH
jgi:hypothetical protein